MNPVMASIIGSGITAGANLMANQNALQGQRELNDIKYRDMIKYAQQYGATPTSIIAGITGNAGGAVPVASTSNNPVPDLGSTINSAVTASSSQQQAVAAKQQSDAALTNAETERMLALMRLKFEPQKYFADIQKSLAQAFESTKNAFLHGSMKNYYDELTTDIQKVRPWKIAGLAQGLANDMATYNKIVQEIETSKAQERFYNSSAYEATTQGQLNEVNSQLVGSQALNESLRGFRLQFENNLLANGIDPTKSFWENSFRLMATNPKLFKERMNMFISALQDVDSKIQDNLGVHYKRNIALGYGLYKLNQIHQQNANNRAYRFNKFGSTISSFIPFAGGGSSSSVPMSSTKIPWYMEDME